MTNINYIYIISIESRVTEKVVLNSEHVEYIILYYEECG